MPTQERVTFRIGVHLILVKNNEVLLSRRYNTGYEDGNYGLIAGHHDGDVSLIDSIIREAKEEADITIAEKDLTVVHVMHTRSNIECMEIFFQATKWIGIPRVMEADKCDDLQWFSLNELPDNMTPSVRQALKNYQENIYFSEYGFEN